MKFGKSIRREMHNHPGMHYLGYKGLKKLIKQIRESQMEGRHTERKQLSVQFENMLHWDLDHIERTFRKIFLEINRMKNEIEKRFSSRIFNNEELKVNKKICSFDNILEMVKEGGVVSEEVLDFCIRLSLLSNKCKVIRTYVVYNYVGLVKILKKMRKRCGSDAEEEAEKKADQQAEQSESRAQLDHLTSASDKVSNGMSSSVPISVPISVANIVATYSWCLSDELPQLITSVNIISDEFIRQLCNSPVTSEKYTCPICLCLIHDPVTLNSCFHSFCWNCLATAIQKYSIDKCPSCRTKIVYDRDSFKIDGILGQFLKKHFMSEPAAGWGSHPRDGGPSRGDEAYQEGPEWDASLSITECAFQNERGPLEAKKNKLIGRSTRGRIGAEMSTRGTATVVERSAPSDVAAPDTADQDFAESILSHGRKDKPDQARDHFFPWHSAPDDGETDPWEDFDEYLTVLNSVDKNVMEDRGRESDSCSEECRDQCREGRFPQSDTTKLGPKGGAPDTSYRLVSDVISYTFS
ncbi:hypothetical protein C922_02799 [Plasmodium inui San Antonio 1]|uniref:RING-type domain-containing protein n=1 Tax=Plasmodium inui San Antonio 1 TaxID=1237626 RepID=W7ACK2_9APIC|nr:hypothetical protein C922_02799 [Plasmodium inui San Antonio 1]EUD66814.1 hypothetical protein C922_02799 [Plasmodium inui San Antonio 1]